MEKINSFEIIPNILCLKTNLDHIHYFSFGFINNIAKVNYNPNNNYLLSASFIVKDKIDIPNLEHCDNFEKFYFNKNEPASIYLIHKLTFKKKLVMKVTLTNNNKATMEIEKFVLRSH